MLAESGIASSSLDSGSRSLIYAGFKTILHTPNSVNNKNTLVRSKVKQAHGTGIMGRPDCGLPAYSSEMTIAQVISW